jgi:hypothetical protein
MSFSFDFHIQGESVSGGATSMEIDHHSGFDSIITTEKDDKISAMDAVLGSIGSFHAFSHPLSVKSSEICTELIYKC